MKGLDNAWKFDQAHSEVEAVVIESSSAAWTDFCLYQAIDSRLWWTELSLQANPVERYPRDEAAFAEERKR